MKYIHRLVAEIYVPGYFEGAHVDHIDCNILNNHYTMCNVSWCPFPVHALEEVRDDLHNLPAGAT